MKLWIVDPFGPAFAGDENSNSDVRAFLMTLDEIKRLADVDSLVVTLHTGRKEHEAGQEHGRGATVLDDWPDARWLLVRDGRNRFFRADGRDVRVEERQLQFDPANRHLTLDGQGRDRRATKTAEDIERVVGALLRQQGLSTRDLEASMGGNKAKNAAAITAAIASGRVRTHTVEKTRKVEHYTSGEYAKRFPDDRQDELCAP